MEAWALALGVDASEFARKLVAYYDPELYRLQKKNIIAFAPHQVQPDGNWRSCELDKMRATFAAEIASGEASGWHVAATEVGDPQFYLLRPPPAETCILAISRLGRLYILDDGAGRVLFEHVSLERLAKQAKEFLHEVKAGFVAGAAFVWERSGRRSRRGSSRSWRKAKNLFHVAPQLAALA